MIFFPTSPCRNVAAGSVSVYELPTVVMSMMVRGPLIDSCGVVSVMPVTVIVLHRLGVPPLHPLTVATVPTNEPLNAAAVPLVPMPVPDEAIVPGALDNVQEPPLPPPVMAMEEQVSVFSAEPPPLNPESVSVTEVSDVGKFPVKVKVVPDTEPPVKPYRGRLLPPYGTTTVQAGTDTQEAGTSYDANVIVELPEVTVASVNSCPSTYAPFCFGSIAGNGVQGLPES